MAEETTAAMVESLKENHKPFNNAQKKDAEWHPFLYDRARTIRPIRLASLVFYT